MRGVWLRPTRPIPGPDDPGSHRVATFRNTLKSSRPRQPTANELRQAHGRGVDDVIARRLRVVFCGINPSLYSAAVGHHFARPGNRFWPTLHKAGFTPRLLSPSEERELLALGCGITNLVNRATARADELTSTELRRGSHRLKRLLRRYRPTCLAVLGVSAYRQAFGVPRVSVGEQEITIDGTAVWVLPNPSGLNAHYQLPDLAKLYRRLHKAFIEPRRGTR